MLYLMSYELMTKELLEEESFAHVASPEKVLQYYYICPQYYDLILLPIHVSSY